MTSAPATESARLSAIVVCPRIAVRPRLVVEVAVERVVVAVAAVVAAVVVASVPASVSVVPAAVVDDGCAVPAAVPAAVPPATADTAHHRSDSDSGAEPNYPGSRYVASGVRRSYIAGNHIRSAVNNRGVVLRHIHNLRIRGLNNNGLWRLLHHGELCAGLEIALCFRLRAKRLNGCHHFGLLVVISLSERRSPGEILRHVIEHGGKFCECLNAGVPRLLVDGLHQRATGQTLVLFEPVVSDGDLVREGRRGQNLGHERIWIQCYRRY